MKNLFIVMGERISAEGVPYLRWPVQVFADEDRALSFIKKCEEPLPANENIRAMLGINYSVEEAPYDGYYDSKNKK